MTIAVEDMITELSSDDVSSAYDLSIKGQYDELHAWLQPIFMDMYRMLPISELKKIYISKLGDKPHF